MTTEEKQKINQGPALILKNHIYGRAQVLWSFRKGLHCTVKAWPRPDLQPLFWRNFLRDVWTPSYSVCFQGTCTPSQWISHEKTWGQKTAEPWSLCTWCPSGTWGSLQGRLAAREVRHLVASRQLPCRRHNYVTGFTYLQPRDNRLSFFYLSPASLGRDSPSKSGNI